MKCALCNGRMRKRKGKFEFKSALIGKVSVPGIEYEECHRCNEKLLSSEMSKKVTSFVRMKEQDSINELPIGDFISLNEAAGTLGVTKQAFSKNPKIKKGLIISKKLGQYTFYLKESVILFKRKGNGKFLLPSFVEPKTAVSALAAAASKSTQPVWYPTFEPEKPYTLVLKDLSSIEFIKKQSFSESDPQQTKYSSVEVLDENVLIN